MTSRIAMLTILLGVAALADEAYRLPEAYVGRGGFSWIHRWSMTKGMKSRGEPDPPAWVTTAPGIR